MDVAKLKETADQANRDKKAAEEQEMKQRQDEERHAANSILNCLSKRCEEAALRGEYKLCVMDVDYAKILNKNQIAIGSIRGSEIDDKLSSGIEFLVYNKCYEMGLNPTVEHWHDGDGRNSGWELWVYWGETPTH